MAILYGTQFCTAFQYRVLVGLKSLLAIASKICTKAKAKQKQKAQIITPNTPSRAKIHQKAKMNNQSDKTKEEGGLSNPSYKDLMARKLQMSRQMTTKKNESLPDKKEEDTDPSLAEYVHVLSPTEPDVENEKGDNGQETHKYSDDAKGKVFSHHAEEANMPDHSIATDEGSIVSAMTLSGASSIACHANITDDILNAKIPSTILGKKNGSVTVAETKVAGQEEPSSQASSSRTNNNESQSFMDPSLVEIPDEWYDRSTFEALEDPSSKDDIADQNTNGGNPPGEPNSAQKVSTKENTGSLLQAGTIVAGAVGLALMLLFPGGSRSEKKKQDGKNKKSDRKHTSLRCGRQDPARSARANNNRGNLLFSDW